MGKVSDEGQWKGNYNVNDDEETVKTNLGFGG